MKRLIPHPTRISALPLLAALLLTAPAAWAGSPHFIYVSVAQDGSTLTVDGKEAGLGNEAQVDILVSADAACINGGSKHPKAANKQSFSAAGTFPVQNGKANFALVLTAAFQPSCDPPMSVDFSNIEVCDLTNDICKKF